MSSTTQTGVLPTGAVYSLEVPTTWNGTLLVYSMPIPVGPDDPPWTPGDRLIEELANHGYAVAASANTIFWPLEATFENFPLLIDAFVATAGRPDRTIGFGMSIGGIITAGLVQTFPGSLSAALPTCGNLGGAVAIHNRELDIAFVIKTLLAGESEIQLVNITDPDANVEQAHTVLAEAQQTPTGRARLALAAAVGNIPGWHDPASPEPAPDEVMERLRNQVAWFNEPGFLVYFGVREQVERQAGGNPSWNTETDYSEILRTSINRPQVEILYEEAGIHLEDDLAVLAAEPRIEADVDAISYLEKHIVFDGILHDTPVLTMHTDGDGLVTPENQHAYADVVGWAGDGDLLRQLYVRRGGHCTFTISEVLTALDVLNGRLDTGRWPELMDPRTLNAAALKRGDRLNLLRTGAPIAPGFFDFRPPPFPRQYDVRDTAPRSPAGFV